MEKKETEFQDSLFRRKGKKGAYQLVDKPNPPLEAPIADTHAHLAMLDNPALSLARCAANGVDFICCISDPSDEDALIPYQEVDNWRYEARHMLSHMPSDSYREGEEQQVPEVRVAIGCHPHNARLFDKQTSLLLLKSLHHPLTCAIGEVGLDYHYDLSPRSTQKEVFREQISLAHESGLPIILHLREAHDDALAILEKEGFPAGGTLLHCYTLDAPSLKPWIEHDCYLAFGGSITFKKSDDIREAAKLVPLNRLLSETDAPYMAPDPMRGMACGPEHSIFVAEKLAELRGCRPGKERKDFLNEIHSNALALLNRSLTSWQLRG